MLIQNAHESCHSTAEFDNPVGAKSNMAGSYTKFYRFVMCTHNHVRIANLSRHSFFEELPVCLSLFPFVSFSPTPPSLPVMAPMKNLGNNACLGHTTGVTQQTMSRAQNWQFSLQVLSALVTPLGGLTMLIGMG